ncbi:hypothetical protein OS493_039442, partial [Desmophyllum pertusum]
DDWEYEKAIRLLEEYAEKAEQEACASSEQIPLRGIPFKAQPLPKRMTASTAATYMFIPPDIGRVAKNQPIEAKMCENISEILSSHQLPLSTENVIEINHMCKKLGSVLHRITKCDISQLEERSTNKLVGHRTFQGRK